MAKAWQSGDLVTNEDFNRYEQGLDEIDQQGQQIDILLALQNGWKYYSFITELGATVKTPLVSVAQAMQDKSILITSIYDPDTTIYPTIGGSLTIKKFDTNRVELSFSYGNFLWSGYIDGGAFFGWKQIATIDEINKITTNGFNGVLKSTGLDSSSDMNDFTDPKHIEVVIDTTDILNFPPVTKGTTRMDIKVEWLTENGTMVRQTINFQAGAVGKGKWERAKIDNVWRDWKQFATTEKTPISITPTAGYTIISQQNYQINNVIHYNFRIKKTDGTAFTSNAQYVVATAPSGKIPVASELSASGLIVNNWYGICSCTLSPTQGVLIGVNSENVVDIICSGTVVL